MTRTRWTGHGHSLSWFSPGNWTRGVPGAQTVTRFTDGRAWTISLAGSSPAQAGSMTVLGDALTFTGGTLALDAAQPKSGNPTDLAIGRGGSVTIALGATIDAQNTINVGSVVAGSLTAGSVAVAGTLDASILDVADGTVQDTGHIALLTGGYTAVVAGGTLAVSAGGTLDAGANSLQNQYSSLDVGANGGDGVATISGAGALLELAGVTVGSDASGVLVIEDGAAARINYLATGSYGATSVFVEGAGTSLQVTNGVTIGNETSLSGLTLSVTDGGAVDAGTYGLALYDGTLVLDSSASLTGAIYSVVGRIEAVADCPYDAGTVTLQQALTLNVNSGAQGQYATATDLFSTGGAVLRIAGQISAYDGATLDAASGSIVLLNAADSYAGTSLFDATLEIGATGAAGAGTLSFTGTGADAPVLQIDADVAFANTIAGFAGADTIDLRGFAFGAGVTDMFSAGTLTLSDGSATTSLVLAGSYGGGSFTFADDRHGGTVVSVVHR